MRRVMRSRIGTTVGVNKAIVVTLGANISENRGPISAPPLTLTTTTPTKILNTPPKAPSTINPTVLI